MFLKQNQSLPILSVFAILACDSNKEVEHLPHHLMVKGFSPAPLAKRGRQTYRERERELQKWSFLTKSIIAQFYVFTILACGISKEVEYLPHHLMVKGLSPAPVTGSESKKRSYHPYWIIIHKSLLSILCFRSFLNELSYLFNNFDLKMAVRTLVNINSESF